MEEEGSGHGRLVDLGLMSSAWDRVGTTCGLRSDSDIAIFLVKYYEDTRTYSQSSAPVCISCHAPLPLTCPTCAVSHKPRPQGECPGSTCDAASLALATSESLSFHSVTQRRHSNGCHVTSDDPKVTADTQTRSVPQTAILKCDLCSSEFTEPDQLTNHLQIHAGEMPYKCADCGAGFLKSSVLDLHLKTHTDDKSHGCNLCGCTFANEQGLRNHSKLQHCKQVDRNGKEKMRGDLSSNSNITETGSKRLNKTDNNNDVNKPGSRNSSSRRKYSCELCGVKFSQMFHLKRHKLAHTGEKSYGCQQCGVAFSQLSSLVIHARSHADSLPFECGSCFRAFKSTNDLKRHKCKVNTKPKPKGFQCDQCLSKFASSVQLTLHMRMGCSKRCEKKSTPGAGVENRSQLTLDARESEKSTEPRPHVCQYCNARFAYLDHLNSHLYEHTGQKAYTCPHCDAQFAHSYRLKVHLRAHEQKRCQCQHCGKQFSSPSNLAAHVRIHSGETPFKCDICQASFKHMGSYNTHVRIHTGEKPYLCQECGRAFTQSSNMRRHMMTHTGERPYVCSQCGKSYTDQGYFKLHQRLHSGLKPHQCSHCDKAFSTAERLKNHLRTHTGEKPFKCIECGAAFAISSSLKEHMRIHTGEKPYKCWYCGRGFAKSCNRLAHMRTHKAYKEQTAAK